MKELLMCSEERSGRNLCEEKAGEEAEVRLWASERQRLRSALC